jgi:hypothetical protein
MPNPINIPSLVDKACKDTVKRIPNSKKLALTNSLTSVALRIDLQFPLRSYIMRK